MGGNRDGIYPETGDQALANKVGLNDMAISPGLVCVGHTHRPLIRNLNNTLVVNAGSTGLPFDGDRRPSYAKLSWSDDHWDAEIVRFDYDHEKAVEDFDVTGYLKNAGPLTELVLIELKEARSQLYQWAVKYQERVMSGEISMHESVQHFLVDPVW